MAEDTIDAFIEQLELAAGHKDALLAKAAELEAEGMFFLLQCDRTQVQGDLMETFTEAAAWYEKAGEYGKADEMYAMVGIEEIPAWER